ncbi:MAG: FKBP-type peptidyl-prolyl cis-trans isomerase [Thermoplasmata archaeon]
MARPLVRDEEGLSTLWSFVGVLILILAILGVYFGYVVPKFPPPPLRALAGDTVQVDYIGTFQNDLVFDTSLESVATDNASYPKALTFSWRSSWDPLPFTIGTGSVVPGFDLGVQGLAEGEAKTVVVPPDQGYGLADPTKVFIKPLLESVPVRLTMNASGFAAVYHTDAVGGSNVTDPLWGWTATVGVAGSIVTVTNSPSPGEIVRPHGLWDARVLSIDDGADGGIGRIQVQHLLTAESVDRVGRRLPSGRVEFVVTAVDPAAGTYTLDFNDPVRGRTLVFQVTMVHIVRQF